MKVIVSRVADLDHELYEKVYSLNLRESGYVRDNLRDAYRKKHEHSKVVIAMEGKRVIGWGLLFQRFHNKGIFKEYSVNFYVRKSERKRGIGNVLFAEVAGLLKKEKRKGCVRIWSVDSERFYTRNTSPHIRTFVSSGYKPILKPV